MNNFNIQRLGWYLRQHLTYNYRRLLNSFLGLTLGLSGAHIALMWNASNNYPAALLASPAGQQMIGNLMERTANVTFFISLLYILVGCADTFSQLDTKQKRTAALMLPASNAEKFVGNMVITAVVWPALIVLALVAADAARMLLFGIIGNHIGSFIPYAWSHGLDALRQIDGQYKWLGIMALLQHAGAFVLGSTVFRRRAFIKTAGCLFAFFLVVGYIQVKTHEISYMATIDFDRMSVWMGILGALFVAEIALAYRLFSRMQVIRRKLL